MSEFKMYTDEQLDKIERLRAEAAKKDRPSLNTNDYHPLNKEIEKDTRVYVTDKGVTMVGYVLSVKDSLYTISTPYGIMKNVELSKLRYRTYKDLSHVIIPAELKTMSTSLLLDELRNYTVGNSDYFDEYIPRWTAQFTEDELRAELRNRPNIRAKRGRRTVNQFKK